MGRRKIVIEKIKDDKTRQVTFVKRKKGLLKKARELAVLCDCSIEIIIFGNNGQLYEFSSHQPQQILERYGNYKGISEIWTADGNDKGQKIHVDLPNENTGVSRAARKAAKVSALHKATPSNTIMSVGVEKEVEEDTDDSENEKDDDMGDENMNSTPESRKGDRQKDWSRHSSLDGGRPRSSEQDRPRSGDRSRESFWQQSRMDAQNRTNAAAAQAGNRGQPFDLLSRSTGGMAHAASALTGLSNGLSGGVGNGVSGLNGSLAPGEAMNGNDNSTSSSTKNNDGGRSKNNRDKSININSLPNLEVENLSNGSGSPNEIGSKSNTKSELLVVPLSARLSAVNNNNSARRRLRDLKVEIPDQRPDVQTAPPSGTQPLSIRPGALTPSFVNWSGNWTPTASFPTTSIDANAGGGFGDFLLEMQTPAHGGSSFLTLPSPSNAGLMSSRGGPHSILGGSSLLGGASMLGKRPLADLGLVSGGGLSQRPRFPL